MKTDTKNITNWPDRDTKYDTTPNLSISIDTASMPVKTVSSFNRALSRTYVAISVFPTIEKTTPMTIEIMVDLYNIFFIQLLA